MQIDRETVIQWAREAGAPDWWSNPGGCPSDAWLLAVAQKAAEHERSAIKSALLKKQGIYANAAIHAADNADDDHEAWCNSATKVFGMAADVANNRGIGTKG